MADSDRKIEIRISAKNMSEAELEKVRASLSGLRQNASGATTGMNSLSTSITTQASAVALGLVSWTAARQVLSSTVDFLKDAIQEYAKSEAGVMRLTTALRAQGAPVKENLSAFQGLAAHLQATTKYEDDALLSAMAYATALGVLPTEMEGVIAAATNMATILGMDLESAIRTIVKADNESIAAFGKLGISLDLARVKAEGLPYVLGQLSGMSGQAAAEVDTLSGRLALLANVWGGLKEAVGEYVVAAVGGVESLKFLSEFVSTLPRAITLVSTFKREFSAISLNPFTEAKSSWAAFEHFFDNLKEAPKKAAAAQDGMAALNKQFRELERETTAIMEASDKRKAQAAKEAADALERETKVFQDARAKMSGADVIREAESQVLVYQALTRDGIAPTVEETKRLNETVKKAIDVYRQMGRQVPQDLEGTRVATESLLSSTSLLISQLTTWPSAPAGLTGTLKAYADGALLAASVSDQLGNAIVELPPGVTRLVNAYGDLTVAENLVFDASGKVIGNLNGVTGALIRGDGVTKATVPFWQEHAKAIGNVADGFDGLSRVAEMSGHRTTSAVMSIASTTLKAFAQGGPVAGAIAGITAVFSAFADKIFKTEGRKVNDLRDEYVAAAGGIQTLAQRALEAGTNVNALLKASTVKDYEKAIASLNAELDKTKAVTAELTGLQGILADRQTLDWKKAEELATKYGFTLGGLGSKFEAAKLHDDYLTIWNDWQSLTDMGGEVGGMLSGMKEEIGHLVVESMRIGTEIPEQFRPLIEDLIKTGQLFDDNGVAITEMGQLKFGAPLVSEVDKIVLAIKDLVDALKNNLMPTIAGIPRTIEIGVGYKYDGYVDPWSEAGQGRADAGYASGGVVTRPQRAWIAEGGEAEMVGSVRFVQRALEGAFSNMSRRSDGGGRTVIENRIFLDGRELTGSVARWLPDVLASKGVR